MTTYSTNKAWHKINELLPKDFKLPKDKMPREEKWNWRGNKVHLDRYPNPNAEYRIFLHHGVGTNSRQMNMIFGHKMAALGYDIVAIDNLGYGMTEVKQKDITYTDWISLFVDFVNEETKRDPKKVILYGLSAGGMITYNAACLLDNVKGIIGMCFLQTDNIVVGCKTAKTALHRRIGIPLLKPWLYTPLKRIPIPMKTVSKMNKLVNNKQVLKIFLKDKASAGASVQMQFLYEYMAYSSPISPVEFNKCPILLTQPANDQWTPIELTKLTLKGIKAPLTVKILKNAGHYPMEQPGLNQMIETSDKFIKSLKD